MNNKIQELKDKLDKMLSEKPISSPEILDLSMEIDVLIVKYQKKM
jgi:hypothetical protein